MALIWVGAAYSKGDGISLKKTDVSEIRPVELGRNPDPNSVTTSPGATPAPCRLAAFRTLLDARTLRSPGWTDMVPFTPVTATLSPSGALAKAFDTVRV